MDVGARWLQGVWKCGLGVWTNAPGITEPCCLVRHGRGVFHIKASPSTSHGITARFRTVFWKLRETDGNELASRHAVRGPDGRRDR